MRAMCQACRRVFVFYGGDYKLTREDKKSATCPYCRARNAREITDQTEEVVKPEEKRA